jgi:hypothetical protein
MATETIAKNPGRTLMPWADRRCLAGPCSYGNNLEHCRSPRVVQSSRVIVRGLSRGVVNYRVIELAGEIEI